MKKDKVIGVYSITNILNNKKYIGSSYDIHERWKTHIKKLNKKEGNKSFQTAWNKYGIAKFKFEILEIHNEFILKNDLLNREQYYVDLYKVCNRQFGYNVRPDVSSNKGVKFLDTSKMQKASQERVGIKCILYNLDGSFFKVCETLAEASILNKGGVGFAIKSKYHKTKNFLVYPYSENYSLQIKPFVFQRNEPNKDERLKKLHSLTRGSKRDKAFGQNVSKGKLNSKTKQTKSVIQYDLINNKVNEFVSISQASRETKIPSCIIARFANTDNYIPNIQSKSNPNNFLYKWSYSTHQ